MSLPESGRGRCAFAPRLAAGAVRCAADHIFGALRLFAAQLMCFMINRDFSLLNTNFDS